MVRLRPGRVLFYAVFFFSISISVYGCVWLAAVAAGGSVAAVAAAGGSVSDVDNVEVPKAVEKSVYAVEKAGGEITDLSFADGYVDASLNGHKITVRIYDRENGTVTVSVRASRLMVSNSVLAEKILKNYRTFEK